MPADIGTLLVRISADISELKRGAEQAAAEIRKLKETANETSQAVSGWGDYFNRASAGMNSILGGAGSFLGIAFSIYGALRLWSSAIQGFYSLMSTAVSQVDDYQRAIIGTAGMMTSITDQKYQPDLAAAYQQWKVYLDWLYNASLETDRKVAASGQEIFEAARLMGIRGAVAKTKEDVYTVGLLVDYIKSITQGMPERQQLLQEVRSMFEGSMRPGAQALAQFEAIMPGFRDKFEEARKQAMKMGDATPIFALLREALKGTTYAADDMQNTFESLYSTSKSLGQKLMLEGFTPMYNSIVQWGWALVDVFYKQGQLTPQGVALARSLAMAWEGVKDSVKAWVDEILKNPEKVIEIVQRITTFLGDAAKAALELARGIELVVSAIATVTTGGIESLAAALGVAAAAALLLEKNIKGAVAAAAAGYWVGSWMAGLNETTKKGRAETDKASLYLTPEQRAKIEKENPPTAWDTTKHITGYLTSLDTQEAQMPTPSAAASEAIKKQAVQNIRDRGEAITKEVNAQNFKTSEAYNNWFVARYQQNETDKKLTAQERLVTREALINYQLTEGKKLPFESPETPRVVGATKPEKGGGGGRQDPLAQLIKQYNDLLGRIEQTTLDKKLQAIRAEFKMQGEEIKRLWDQGQLSQEQYFSMLDANIRKSYGFEIGLEKQKIDAAERTLKSNLANNKLRVETRELEPDAAKYLDLIEIAKKDLAVAKAKGDMQKLEIEQKKELIKLEEIKYKIAVESFKYSQQTAWAQRTAAGPVSAREVNVEQMWTEFYTAMGKMGMQGPGTQSKPFPYYGPRGMETRTLSFDEEYAKAKEREWEIRWGQVTRGAADAIASGFEDMITSLSSGGTDFKQTANKMFQNLFKVAMKPGLDQLTEYLISGFKQMFKSINENVGLAFLGALALVGMMLTSSKSKSSFTPSGTTSAVTSHESVRGVIAGETEMPISQISTSLQDALVETNGILNQIEMNTRGIGSLQLNLQIDIPGLKDAVAGAMERYFAEYAQTIGG